MPMTQKERVANSLRRAPDGICARWFVYEATPGIPRVAARVFELRYEGFNVLTERCDLHTGHDPQAAHKKYRLATPERLFTWPDEDWDEARVMGRGR